MFGIFLLLCQILRGGVAAAMPCAGDLSDFVVCGAVHASNAGRNHVDEVDCHTNPAPTHCKSCESGACRMTHAPALSIALSPILGAFAQSAAAPQPRIGHFTAPIEEILPPPK